MPSAVLVPVRVIFPPPELRESVIWMPEKPVEVLLGTLMVILPPCVEIG